MDEVRRREERATLEELMYICVLEKFVNLGVQMMPRLDTMLDQPAGSINALTDVSPAFSFPPHRISNVQTLLRSLLRIESCVVYCREFTAKKHWKW